MAKKEIQSLTRTLAKFYEQAEEALSDAELTLKNVALSEEKQKDYSEVKAFVDNELTLLSVGLSAAAQGKINEVIASKEEEGDSFFEQLHLAVTNLSDENIDDESKSATRSLIAVYNDKIDSIEWSLKTLSYIKDFADCPRRKENRRKYIKAHSLARKIDLELMIEDKTSSNSGFLVFNRLSVALDELRKFVKYTLEETKESTAGNLAE